MTGQQKFYKVLIFMTYAILNLTVKRGSELFKCKRKIALTAKNGVLHFVAEEVKLLLLPKMYGLLL